MKKFSEKLRTAMQQLNLNQVQVAGMTGKSKASVSMYLNGETIPPEKVQSEIAVSLGLAPDYFRQDEEPVLKLMKRGRYIIPQLSTKDAARMLRMGQKRVESGLIQGRWEWGNAIETSPGHWRYYINARRFAAIEMIEVPEEMIK